MFKVLLLAVVMGSFVMPMNALAAENKNPRFTEPMDGPELTAPINRPGIVGPDLSLLPGSKTKADDAYGAFQRGYYLTAFQLALPRAESGDPAAQTLIAELYWNGFGVTRDRKKAVEWYQFAANAGGREAQFFYANILLRGKVVPEDKKQGEIYMRKAAEANHSRAQFNLAQIIAARRPTWAGFKKALPWYEKAASSGLADAQYALANIHAEAKGVPYNDDKKAFELLTQSATGGFDSAQVDLAIWLSNGRGAPKNLKMAHVWFSRAASQGNVVAQNRLSRMYAFGVGVKKDVIRAGAWHILARRAGFSDSKMDSMFAQLPEIDKKRAIEAANQLSKRSAS